MNKNVSLKSGITKMKKYERVVIEMKHFFSDREFTQNQQIPTEFELMKIYQVSRTTIRRALYALEEMNIIRRTQGSGTFYCGHEKESRNTRTSKGLIGLVNYYYLDYIYGEIIRGIEDTLSESGYTLILANSNESETKQRNIIKRMIEQGIKGLILEPSRNLLIDKNHKIAELLQHSGIAVVNTHWGIKNCGASTVTLDDFHAGYQAAQYLMSKGHRLMGIIYKSDVQAGFERYRGFSKAIEDHGLVMDEKNVKCFTQKEEMLNNRPGYYLTAEILGASRGIPTALFYMNDRLALDGYVAIKEAGFSIPQDISVLGFDDYETASLVQPGLTTYIHPKYRLGKWAARVLVDILETQPPRIPLSLTFEAVLKERDSVRNLQAID